MPKHTDNDLTTTESASLDNRPRRCVPFAVSILRGLSLAHPSPRSGWVCACACRCVPFVVSIPLSLSQIRLGVCEPDVEKLLRSRIGRKLDESDGIVATKLFTHKADCLRVNTEQLKRLGGEVARSRVLEVLVALLEVAVDQAARAAPR